MRMTHVALAATLCLALPLGACGQQTSTKTEGEATAEADYERGPHNGRMIRDGNIALEVTIFEDGVPPEYRIYAYRD
ncbi:MAG: HlyD family secretion protein, partial [Hyphomicrobium sp.]|nr:HlyD family secretion protein [Hyphomicrobium sp.]